MLKNKLNPLQQFTIFLSIYSVVATGFNFSNEVILHLLATLGFGVVLFYVLQKISKKKKSIWNTIATCLIIFLILGFSEDIAEFIYSLLATFIAVIFKFFFEWKGRPIINPAVFALLVLVSVAALIPGMESPFISWWGASFKEPLALVLLLVWVLSGLNVWKKWPLFVSFLVPYAALVYFLQGEEFFEFIFTSGTIFFFAAIMLIEPKTSPIKRNQQIICGILTAIVYPALMYYGASNTELLSLAAMNLLNFGFILYPRK
ncbi:MAG: hypothetical protein Q8P68_04665 [Candidatus Peregrinibacteria bacterium]|nr:hypothetical protein [Candidatus Peregrinibacteria bacterium]MDZ4244674.1 hypothetical protein [Candidatus Gracilibacteria bacterium]